MGTRRGGEVGKRRVQQVLNSNTDYMNTNQLEVRPGQDLKTDVDGLHKNALYVSVQFFENHSGKEHIFLTLHSESKPRSIQIFK